MQVACEVPGCDKVGDVEIAIRKKDGYTRYHVCTDHILKANYREKVVTPLEDFMFQKAEQFLVEVLKVRKKD